MRAMAKIRRIKHNRTIRSLLFAINQRQMVNLVGISRVKSYSAITFIEISLKNSACLTRKKNRFSAGMSRQIVIFALTIKLYA